MTTDLMRMQNRFLELHPSPEQGRSWLKMKIEDKWHALIHKGMIDEKQAKMAHGEIEDLHKSLYLGENPDLLAGYDQLPESIKSEWVGLLYKDNDVFSLHRLNRLVELLNEHRFSLPPQRKVEGEPYTPKSHGRDFRTAGRKNQRCLKGSIERARQ